MYNKVWMVLDAILAIYCTFWAVRDALQGKWGLVAAYLVLGFVLVLCAFLRYKDSKRVNTSTE